MKICLYGNLDSTLMGSPIGGGELQLVYLAKQLAKNGSEVIIVDLEGDKDYNHSENLKVISLNKFIQKKRRYLKYFYLFQLFLMLNADIYHCRIRGWIHIIPFLVSKKNDSIFSLSLASDLDVGNFWQRYKYFYRYKGFFYFITQGILTETLFSLLLKKADIVFAQNHYQKKTLESKKINNELLLNIFDYDEIITNGKIIKDKDYFIYVSSLDSRKGFDTFLTLAQEAKNVKFKVVGDYRGKNLFTNTKLNNIEYLGRLSHLETIKMISGARALISTSKKEGFPNIFLEAWATGVPVISYAVDPNDLLSTMNLGYFCKYDFKKLVTVISYFDKYYFSANELITYVLKNHNTKIVTKIFIKAINNIKNTNFTKTYDISI